MAKKPRRTGVAPSLCLKLCMIRGLDLTLAGTLIGAVQQHGCKAVVRVGDQTAGVGNVLDMVALCVQPQSDMQLIIAGRNRAKAAQHIRTISNGRWAVIESE